MILVIFVIAWKSNPSAGIYLTGCLLLLPFFSLQASKKITDAKLAKDFQAVLKEFQKAQRLAAERETAYTPFVPQALPSR